MSPTESDPSTETNPPSPAYRVWSLALAAGLFAGFASWMIGEAFLDRLQPGLRVAPGMPTAEESRAGALGFMTAVIRQASLAYGSLGAALGLGMGLAGGAARGSARSTAIAATSGAILGGIAGMVMSHLLLPVYFRFYDPDSDDLILASLIQGGICGVVGGVGGASLEIGDRGRPGRGALGGLLGAVAGVLIYVMVGTLAFPLDQTTKPISATSGSRLMARLLVALLAAAGAAKLARASSTRRVGWQVLKSKVRTPG